MSRLFSASLEKHMRAYKKNVKLSQLNIEYQAMQNKIVQEGERMQLSQAEIQNKLEQLKQELLRSNANEIISINKTNAPEQVKEIIEDESSKIPPFHTPVPPRAPVIYKTSAEINELAKMGEEDLLPIIKELKDYRAKRKQFEEEIIMATNNINRLKINNNLKKLKEKEEKKMQYLNTKIMKKEDLLNSIQNRLANLRPAERNTYKEPISQFKKELAAEIKARNTLKVEISPSTVTTVNTSPDNSPDNSPILNTISRKGNWIKQKAEITKKLEKMYNDYDVPKSEQLKIDKYTTQNDILNYEKNFLKNRSIWL